MCVAYESTLVCSFQVYAQSFILILSNYRCAVCSPGVLSAISVCKAAFKTVDHKCVQEVMGEGFCNYCIADFLV